MPDDPYNLQRFIDAQDPVYVRVSAELCEGVKRSHWMWFIFPQLAGLGYSSMARKFAISSLDEARAYLNHPVLGARLIECTELVNRIRSKSIEDVFGYPDDLKFRSCMTLFATAAPQNEVFKRAIDKYFEGKFDSQTERLLSE